MKHEQGQQWTGQAGSTGGPQETGPVLPDDQQGPDTAAAQPSSKLKRTRTGIAWVAALVALVLLVFLLVFILQNLESTTVDFLGFSGSLPLALAMLFSAIGGAALVALIGVARIVQLRRAARGPRKAR